MKWRDPSSLSLSSTECLTPNQSSKAMDPSDHYSYRRRTDAQKVTFMSELICKANEAETILLSECEEEFIQTQFDKEHLNAVLDEETGKLLELRELLKGKDGKDGKDGKRWGEGSYRELS